MKAFLAGLSALIPLAAAVTFCVAADLPIHVSVLVVVGTFLATLFAAFAVLDEGPTPASGAEGFRYLVGHVDVLSSGDARHNLGADPREGWIVTPDGAGLFKREGATLLIATPSPVLTPHPEVAP